MERLDNQSQKIEQLDKTVHGLSEKVGRISRDFAYIKKAWWAVLILIGIALNRNISPMSCYGRQSARCDKAYSLKPLAPAKR